MILIFLVHILKAQAGTVARTCSIPHALPHIPWPVVVIYLVLLAVGMPSINVNSFLSKISIAGRAGGPNRISRTRNGTHQSK